MIRTLLNLTSLKTFLGVGAIFAISPAIVFAQQAVGLTNSDVTLIREAFHLQSVLGNSIWPGWNSTKAPFLYKTRDWDYVINHPSPPREFTSTYDKSWGDSLWIRANTDTLDYQATFPISGIPTVVITSPSKSYDPYLWVLKAVHELFHVYQGLDRIVNPFVGPYGSKNELSFPFDYSNSAVLAGCRVESELLFTLVTKERLAPGDSTVSPKVFRDMQKLLAAVLVDSLHLRYKRWIEWSEGVARYTERELAGLSRNLSFYKPTKEFRSLFPWSSYSGTWTDYYEGMVNPIRFVGEGGRGRVMFYYSGMAKAYVLDRIRPDWRSKYFSKTLDEILIQ